MNENSFYKTNLVELLVGWSLVLYSLSQIHQLFYVEGAQSSRIQKAVSSWGVWDVDLQYQGKSCKNLRINEFHTGELCQSWQMQVGTWGMRGRKGIRKIGKTSEGKKRWVHRRGWASKEDISRTHLVPSLELLESEFQCLQHGN